MKNHGFHSLIGPAEDAARLYWRGTDSAMKGLHPAAKSALRANYEYAGFALRQTRAAMDLPSHMMKCRTPVEFANIGVRFWMGAFEDFVSVNERVMTVLTQASAVSAGPSATIGDWTSVFSGSTQDPTASEPADNTEAATTGTVETIKSPIKPQREDGVAKAA